MIIANYKKYVTWVVVFLLLLALFPQNAFADEATGTLTWSSLSAARVGNSASGKVQYSNVDPENIAFKSGDEKIVPSEYIVVSNIDSANSIVQITYYPIRKGTVTITAYDKTNPDVIFAEKSVTTKAVLNTSKTVWLGKAVNCSRDVPYPLKYQIADETIATVDDEGNVTGKTLDGVTKLNMTSEVSEEVVIADTITVREDLTGIYCNGERITYDLDGIAEISLDKNEVGNKVQLQIKKGVTEYTNNETRYVLYWDSSNIDVAKPVYEGFNAANHQVITGNVELYKNGTATIYVYSYVNRVDSLLCTIKLNVTGFDETSDSEDGWKELSEAQGILGKIQLLEHPQQYQSYDESMYDNRITQYLKADNVNFNLQFNNKSGTPQDATEEVMNNWKEAVLKLINIYEVNEDGSLGEIVASNGNGYTLLSGPYANPFDAPLQIKIDEKLLKKGTTYALVADAGVSPVHSMNGKELYSTGYIALNVIWKFTTSPAASSVTVNPEEAVINNGESLTLTATMDEGSRVDPDDIIIWTSEDESIASVDNEGKVTANATGRTVITATALDGKVSDSCTVTVPGILLKDPADAQIELTEGDTYKLEADLYSADAEQKIEWSSSDESVATVDADGIITAVGEGEAVITGTAGEYTVESTVTVNAAPAGYEPVNNTDPSGDGEDPSGDGNAAEAENGQENDGSAKTGDDMNIWMLIALLGASGAAGAAALRRRAKQ